MSDFLHLRSDFNELLAIVAEEHGIDPVLVEKDYWIMHCLWGLQALNFRFELKGRHLTVERLWCHSPVLGRH